MIQKEVAKAGLSESYYEIEPQSIFQIVLRQCSLLSLKLCFGRSTSYQSQINWLDLLYLMFQQ